MSARGRASLIAAISTATFLWAGAGFAQQGDAFAAACMKSGTSASKCACQSKIARANLDRREQQAALSALRGDKENFGKQVRAMGQAKAKVFSGKMQKLSTQSRAHCT